jgi:hypothetical protein
VICVPGKQILHRFGQHMRIIVPDELQRVASSARVIRASSESSSNGPRKVPHLAVDPRRQRRLGKARPDRRRDVGRRRARLDLANGAIGKADLELLRHSSRM